jgi:hypothetical protein
MGLRAPAGLADALPTGPPPAPPAPPFESDAQPGTSERAADFAADLQRRLEARLRELDAEPGLSLSQRVAIEHDIAAQVKQLGRLTGSGILNERQILMTPCFKTLLAALRDSLRGRPYEAEALGLMADAVAAHGRQSP